ATAEPPPAKKWEKISGKYAGLTRSTLGGAGGWQSARTASRPVASDVRRRIPPAWGKPVESPHSLGEHSPDKICLRPCPRGNAALPGCLKKISHLRDVRIREKM